MIFPLRSLLVAAALTFSTIAIPQHLQDRSSSCQINGILSLLHEPEINHLASSFCSTFIRSTTTVLATATATATASTTLIALGITSTITNIATVTTDLLVTITIQAPDPTTIATVPITVTSTTTTVEITMKRKMKQRGGDDIPIPWFFSGYLTSGISSACSCLVSPASITICRSDLRGWRTSAQFSLQSLFQSGRHQVGAGFGSIPRAETSKNLTGVSVVTCFNFWFPCPIESQLD